LVLFILFGLYGVLKKLDKPKRLLAFIFGLLGIFLYITVNQSFSMLNLSQLYANATSETQRQAFLPAGESVFSIYNPGRIHQSTAYYLSHFLVNFSGLLFSWFILKEGTFNKITAYSGIIAYIFLLPYFIPLLFAPDLTFISISFAAPFLMLYYILVGRLLILLGKSKGIHENSKD
jgi:hypothetical protein